MSGEAVDPRCTTGALQDHFRTNVDNVLLDCDGGRWSSGAWRAGRAGEWLSPSNVEFQKWAHARAA